MREETSALPKNEHDRLILAPLRGVTIRAFRETFAPEIAEAGFAEAVTPFITAAPGYDPLGDRELRGLPPPSAPQSRALLLTPQFIGKDPAALRDCLLRVKAAGYVTADLNAGCPFPMVRNKGRGSGLLRTPGVLERMIATGCEVMGPGCFSLKTRLGVERSDELAGLMPMINAYPLRYLTVHARTARQMYEGECDRAALAVVERLSRLPRVRNGDIPFPPSPAGRDAAAAEGRAPLMIGRGFVRALGAREDARELLRRYLAATAAELPGDRPVLGRMKELVAYWKDLPGWRRLWPIVKIARSVDEFASVL